MVKIMTHRSDPYILTLDLGSSSTRALLFDRHGQAVDSIEARIPYELQSGSDGSSIDDPDQAVARAVACIDLIVAEVARRQWQIAAVAVDTLAATFIVLDGAGKPLTPLISYADTRNASDAEQLQASYAEAEVHQRTGCLLRTSYWPARLAWLRRSEPAIWRQAKRFVSLGEYVEQALFGSGRAAISPASWTGMLDRRRNTWDTELCAALEVDLAQLGQICDTSEPRSDLRPSYASRWPLLRGVPWFAALGDGAAANLGSGCVGPGRVALTVGTTGALRVVREQVEQVPAGLWCYRVDRRRALLGGATSEGGNVYAWLRRTLQLDPPEQLEAALAALPAASHGVQVLPFWAGERSPGWAGDARASIVGLQMATTPTEIVRACFEGVAYRFGLIAEQLLRADPHATVVVSGGGLLQSAAWTQIVADVLGRELHCSEEREATARGCGLIALEALGLIANLDELPARIGRVVHPNMENHARYREQIEHQQHLYRHLIAPPQP
ncbi:MAG: gluconokinase [Roseiflexaceae bacterium]